MSKVKYSTQGQVAVLTLDNPPLNTFGYEQRRDLALGISKAEEDQNIKAIIITGSDKAFSGELISVSLVRRKYFYNLIYVP